MSATRIDWLGVSFKNPVNEAHRLLDATFRPIGQVELEQRRGMHGFTHSQVATLDGAHVGMLAWGGESQNGRCYVELSGVGCGLVPDLSKLLERILVLPGATLKRVDIAADFHHGERSYEDMLLAYESGKFCRWRRSPKLTQILPGDPAEGRTAYVGRRGSDVYLRCYEKGKKEHHPEYPRWNRIEVELRPDKRPLPFEVIPMRDQFFAGCYPYLAEILPDVKPEILVTPQRIAASNIEHSLANVRTQWGPTLRTAAAHYDGDILAVWDRIVGTVHNQRLVEAGALLRQVA